MSQQVSTNTSHPHVVALDMSKAFDTVNMSKAFDTVNMSKAFDTVNIHTLIVKLTHHTQIHRKLHQRTHDIHNIREPIYKMPIQIRSSTRWRPFTNTLQHLHFRHPTAPYADINIATVNIQPYLHDILKWTKDNDLLLYTDKTTCTQSPQTQQNIAHNTTHDHTPKNTRTHTWPQTHLQQTHRPGCNQSTQNNQHTQSPHLDKVGQT